MEEMKGKKVIVRGDRSGVAYGTFLERQGQEVKLADCRKLWYWSGAASLYQLAAEGVKKPDECKFTMRMREVEILDAIEILPCTEEAVKSIESVEEWKL